MKITEKLYNDASKIWGKIVNHPFVIEIYSGSLPEKKFKFYALQDYNYLVGITRAMTIIASKSDFWKMKEILILAQKEAGIELQNYEKLLKSVGLSIEEAMATEPSPTNLAYMNYIGMIAYTGDVYEGIAGILPCFWSYQEIAKKNRYLLKKNKNSIYLKWAETYFTEEYKQIVEKMKNMLNEAKNYDAVKKIFLTASKYEYMFWEMSYKMERWQI
ncbi:MAG: thiaminase II [Thermoplasmata archaeon]|nr:thiaminase II [Thermoplasmata archaeon]